eukprot:scaffold789_cov261-Pinguiococcus_pyrenoidosus.AAC.23
MQSSIRKKYTSKRANEQTRKRANEQESKESKQTNTQRKQGRDEPICKEGVQVTEYLSCHCKTKRPP